MKIELSPQINILPIQAGDADFLIDLMCKVYKDSYHDFWIDGGDWYTQMIYNTSNIHKELKRVRSHYFFVEVEGEKVGILKYDFPFSPRETEIPNAMKLHRLYLSPKVHGKGIAVVLMKHIETVASENDLDWIWLEAMDAKPQAKRFYEKNDYQIAHTYVLDFEHLKPEYREIHIMKKKVPKRI
ncbi:GNAT family N-acetyltransferase [Algoriphagus sp. PAP.12]|uniref:GNAT family N-acetyltransferase n=1 Tax=Algoriphagus sp. PAP.12 TaxID=2996678 RepID=UPI00227A28D8|nr:GNAT family N-acetyltransferase [Algoriphagus sp. PAP.12]